ncbi:hypothetical protein [Streptomyces phaeofaciens]|uniref:hypothetical protein n=1 Tax=Streptomyces phaeofaciens TaxID=68254 RepID=UPI00368005EF
MPVRTPAMRAPHRAIRAHGPEPPPEKAVWDIGVSKGEKGELRLFFLTSDPDVRDTYYLTRDTTTASP